jgi:hypothetical protein
MSWGEAPPWKLGDSLLNGRTPSADEDGYPNLEPQLEGKLYQFVDQTYGTGLPMMVRIVRNSTGSLVKPAECYTYDTDYPNRRVNARTTVLGANSIVADPLLPSAGIQDKDLFYAILSGPTLVTTPRSAMVALAKGDALVAGTASTTGNQDAGCIARIADSLVAATTVAQHASNLDISRNVLGRAMSAATTANTGAQILINMAQRF